MHRRTFITNSTFVSAGLAAGAGGLGIGLGTGTGKADEDPDGFRSLFDGKTLKGWHRNKERIGHGTGGNWQVEDGVLSGEQDPPGSGNGGILLTDDKFGDFELELDIMPDWGVCSGLFLRSTEKGQCFQAMVDYHDAGNVGHIYGEGTGGFNTRTFDINGEYTDDKKLKKLTWKKTEGSEKLPEMNSISGEKFCAIYKPNDWNRVKVRCAGEYPKITTWINGEKILDFDAGTFAGPGYDKEKVKETLGVKGHIAVQVHGGSGWPKGSKCRWRNIRIKEL